MKARSDLNLDFNFVQAAIKKSLVAEVSVSTLHLTLET